MTTLPPAPTLDDGLDVLQAYYDNVLNTDSALVETSNDVPTPIACVTEMLDKIPTSFWTREEIKILDPCCGCGNFPLVIYFKLLQHHTKEHILQHILYFNDLNGNRLERLKAVFGSEINVYQTDFLTLDVAHPFDLIVANPPYARLLPNGKRASKNHNLIGAFIEQSLSMLRPRGFLLYITPDNWMSFADRNTLILRLTELRIHHINIHTAKKYFKTIGSSFVWYLIENTKAEADDTITIDGIWKKTSYTSTVRPEIRPFIPLYYTNIVQSIINKTLDDSSHGCFNVETSSDLHKYTKKALLSATEDTQHPYRLIHTPKQTVWSTRPHKFQEGHKVFLSTTSYYQAFVDDCGMTQSIAFVRCADEEEAKALCKVLGHPLYVFLNNICRYGNFNNIRVMQHFPLCLESDKVYDTFGLSNEEIECVEEHTV